MEHVLTRREKTTVYITIGVIVFAFGFNFLIAPILNKYDTLNKEINHTRTKLKKYLWLLSQKDYLQNKYNKFYSVDKPFEQQEDALVSALSILENLARNADVRIIDIRPRGGSRNLRGYKEVLVDLRAEGAMEGYFKFIYNLENSLLLLKIKKFRLTTKANTQFLEGDFSISQLSASD